MVFVMCTTRPQGALCKRSAMLDSIVNSSDGIVPATPTPRVESRRWQNLRQARQRALQSQRHKCQALKVQRRWQGGGSIQAAVAQATHRGPPFRNRCHLIENDSSSANLDSIWRQPVGWPIGRLKGCAVSCSPALR